MGRKGVSKRKPVQTKSKPYSGGANSSVVPTVESQPVKSIESGKVIPFSIGGMTAVSDKKKKGRKG